jgi:chromosome segregation ATPase
VEDRDAALSERVTTNAVEATSIDTTQVNISELPITSNGVDLLVNSKEVALVEEVPKIQYLTQEEYEALEASGKIDPDTYYYTTNEEIYLTKTEYNTKVEQINTSITAANTAINALTTTVGQLETQLNTLLETIESLKSRLEILEQTSEEDVEEPVE